MIRLMMESSLSFASTARWISLFSSLASVVGWTTSEPSFWMVKDTRSPRSRLFLLSQVLGREITREDFPRAIIFL